MLCSLKEKAEKAPASKTPPFVKLFPLQTLGSNDAGCSVFSSNSGCIKALDSLSRDTLETLKVDYQEDNDRLHNFSLVVIPANVDEHTRARSLSLVDCPACDGLDPCRVQVDKVCINEENQPFAGTESRAKGFSKRECSREGEPYVFKADNFVSTKGQVSAGPGDITKKKRGRPPLTSGNPKAFKKDRKKMPECFKGF